MSAQLQMFDIDAGIRQRDIALEKIIDSHHTFIHTARDIARLLCKRQGTVSMDDVRFVLDKYGIEPFDSHAYGAIFRGKEWRQVGWTRSELISNHARSIRTWKLV